MDIGEVGSKQKRQRCIIAASIISIPADGCKEGEMDGPFEHA